MTDPVGQNRLTRVASFVALLVVALVIGGLAFMVMRNFLLPMFLAILLTIMFRPLYLWLSSRTSRWLRPDSKFKNALPAGITTIGIVLIVMLPLLWVIVLAADEALSVASGLDQETLVRNIARLRQRMNLELPPEPVQRNLQQIETAIHSLAEDANAAPGIASDDQRVVQRRQAIAMIHQWLNEVEADLASAPPKNVTGAAHTTGLGQLRTSLTSLDEVAGDDIRFARQIALVEPSFDEFESQVYGGAIMGWLKRQANPDAEKLAALRVRIQSVAAPWALGTTQFVGGFLVDLTIGLGVMLLSLYYFLSEGPAMMRTTVELLPLDPQDSHRLLSEFDSLTRAIVLSILLAALAQGLLASIGYLFAGLGSLFLLTLLTMVFAMVPFIGSTVVWGSACLWLWLHDGRGTAAAVLAGYCILVVGMADNLVKPWVLHGRSNLHPLLALLSVLGGVQALGPIGILVGPMVVAFLVVLLAMLRSNLSALDQR